MSAADHLAPAPDTSVHTSSSDVDVDQKEMRMARLFGLRSITALVSMLVAGSVGSGAEASAQARAGEDDIRIFPYVTAVSSPYEPGPALHPGIRLERPAVHGYLGVWVDGVREDWVNNCDGYFAKLNPPRGTSCVVGRQGPSSMGSFGLSAYILPTRRITPYAGVGVGKRWFDRDGLTQTARTILMGARFVGKTGISMQAEWITRSHQTGWVLAFGFGWGV